MKYKAVIFDLDGTLLDSLEDIADTVNTILDSFGFPVHHKEVYKKFVGDGIQVLAERSFPLGECTDANVKRFVSLMRSEYAKRWHNKSRLYDGIPGLLADLVSNDMPIAILSNKPHEFTVQVVAHFLADWSFTHVYGAQAGIPKKPEPSSLLHVVREIGCAPHECIYLGDSDVDMQTAKRAGVCGIGALWGFRDRAELDANGAVAIVESPSDVLKYIHG